MKNRIGISIVLLIVLFVLLLTIRLSGHKTSLGILFIGLLAVDFVAIVITYIFYAFSAITTKVFFTVVALILIMISVFFFYHRSYDSYNETRKLFWGLNGEIGN